MRVKLGIDLGTSNVVIAYMKAGQLCAVEWEPIGNGVLLPAYVQFRNGDVVCGKQARYAWEQGETGTHRRFKMLIGRDPAASPTAVELMSALIRAARQNLIGNERLVSEISEIESAVITVPHGWKEDQRRHTRTAVEDAGIPDCCTRVATL